MEHAFHGSGYGRTGTGAAQRLVFGRSAKYKEALEAWKKEWTGKLRGKIVLLSKPKVPGNQTNPQFRRYTAAELADMANAPAPVAKLDCQEAG